MGFKFVIITLGLDLSFYLGKLTKKHRLTPDLSHTYFNYRSFLIFQHFSDIDECTDGTHTCGKLQCINMPGSFKCRCAAGYEFNETTKLCEDVDECKKFQGHICSQHATCENVSERFG